MSDAVTEAVKALFAEPLYEGGNKANGVAVRFLMRMNILRAEAGIVGEDDPFVREARAALDRHGSSLCINGLAKRGDG